MSRHTDADPSHQDHPHRRDLEMVAGCVGGDRAMWVRLIQEHERTLYLSIAATLRRCGYPQEALSVEELQADLMVDLVKDDFRKLKTYSGRCSLRQWLKVVAANSTIDRLRTRKDHLSLDGDGRRSQWLRATLEDRDPAPDEQVAWRRRASWLAEALQGLTEEDRRFVHLFWGQGMDYAEIAEAMETTVDAIYARKSRVRRKLRRAARLHFGRGGLG